MSVGHQTQATEQGAVVTGGQGRAGAWIRKLAEDKAEGILEHTEKEESEFS